MNFALYGCEKSAEYPFACCSPQHGYQLKNILAWFGQMDEAKALAYMDTKYPGQSGEALQHYRDFINRNEPHGTEENSSVLHEPQQ